MKIYWKPILANRNSLSTVYTGKTESLRPYLTQITLRRPKNCVVFWFQTTFLTKIKISFDSKSFYKGNVEVFVDCK